MQTFMMIIPVNIILLLIGVLGAEDDNTPTTTTLATIEKKSAEQSEKSGFLSVVDYLTDNNNGKQSETPVQGFMTSPMYPVYPTYNQNGYFYPALDPNAVGKLNPSSMQATNYFSSILPIAQTIFEIIRNVFLYFLIRHFVLKLLKVFDLLINLRDVIVSDNVSRVLTKAALQAALKLFARLGLFVMGGAGLLIIGGVFTTVFCYLTPICTISFNGYDFRKALDKEAMRSLMTPEKIASAAALVQDAIGKYQRLQRAIGQ